MSEIKYLKHKYSIGGSPLDNLSDEKVLSIMVTESFKSRKQCNIAAVKANKILGIFQKNIFMWGRCFAIKSV